MAITKEQIETRRAQLLAEKEQLENNILQLQANLSAYNGAIQDCEYWLKLLQDGGGNPAPVESTE